MCVCVCVTSRRLCVFLAVCHILARRKMMKNGTTQTKWNTVSIFWTLVEDSCFFVGGTWQLNNFDWKPSRLNSPTMTVMWIYSALKKYHIIAWGEKIGSLQNYPSSIQPLRWFVVLDDHISGFAICPALQKQVDKSIILSPQECCLKPRPKKGTYIYPLLNEHSLAPEIGPSQKEIHLPTIHFQG